MQNYSFDRRLPRVCRHAAERPVDILQHHRHGQAGCSTKNANINSDVHLINIKPAAWNVPDWSDGAVLGSCLYLYIMMNSLAKDAT